MLSSSNLQLSLFLMSIKSYLKFRTIRGTPQKWVGFGKPLLYIYVSITAIYQTYRLGVTKLSIGDLEQLKISKVYPGCYVLHCLLTGNVHHVQNISPQTSLFSNMYARNVTLLWTCTRGYGIVHDLMYKHLEKLQNYACGQ